jgi:AAA15 family ATPase/GTPase
MLTGLTVENFRGFDKHKIPLNEVTVIVGQNNAGKS